MAEPSTHINYSFEDIQRYLQGKMSAAEMHDIEKAALQDPFLADAIEGFNEVNAEIAQQHLHEINAALLKEKKESKLVAFNKKTQWLNVAAIIIVLAGIGVVASYFFKSSNKQTQVAQLKNEPAKNEVSKDSATNAQNTLTEKPDTNSFIAENKVAKKTKPLKLKKEVIKNEVVANKDIEDDKANVADIVAARIPESQNNSPIPDTPHYDLNALRSFAAMEKTYNNNDSVQNYLQGKVSGVQNSSTTFTSKVVDESNKPIPGVLIQSADKKNAVLTDLNGNFSLQKEDTALNVIVSTVGYNNKIARLQSGYNNPIVLKGTSSNLNDVVVTTALGAAKQRKPLADSAMPVGGWENFNHYVLTQLNEDSTRENYMSERNKVELEFLVDNRGNPYDIRVIKPLDDERNSKAIDILKSGPKWTNTSKKKKAKVAITIPSP